MKHCSQTNFEKEKVMGMPTCFIWIIVVFCSAFKYGDSISVYSISFGPFGRGQFEVDPCVPRETVLVCWLLVNHSILLTECRPAQNCCEVITVCMGRCVAETQRYGDGDEWDSQW